MIEIDRKWNNILESLDYAFQPIVNVHSGKIYGIEALVRGSDNAGFNTIDAMFNQAYYEDVLYNFDILLRDMAIRKFVKIDFHEDIKLFFNVDSRIAVSRDYASGNTAKILKQRGVKPANFCIELSEKHEIDFPINAENMLINIYRDQGYKIAIDDFGAGYSGLKLLYASDPDFIKIDRFFINDIENNRKKRLFISNIVDIAQTLGITTIAEGIENEKEFYICKEMGCNFVQGYFIAKPSKDISNIKKIYDSITLANENSRRNQNNSENLKSKILKIEPIDINSDMHLVLESFRKNKELEFLPAIDSDKSPLGLIKEYTLKEYTYSPFGQALLQNQANSRNLKKFVTQCGIADINSSVEKILQIYSYNAENDGLIITSNGKYKGFLSARVLLDLINEKNIINAKNVNPLTGLPGNNQISEFITSASEKKEKIVLVYYDFDNFKPFNDLYGFRKGDRAIVLFADILKEMNGFLSDCLVGHIGGDDFFMGCKLDRTTFENICDQVKKSTDKFKNDVESFYDEKDRKRGHIVSKNRDGETKKFDLLTVSASILSIEKPNDYSEEYIGEILANLKKSAKASDNKIVTAALVKF